MKKIIFLFVMVVFMSMRLNAQRVTIHSSENENLKKYSTAIYCDEDEIFSSEYRRNLLNSNNHSRGYGYLRHHWVINKAMMQSNNPDKSKSNFSYYFLQFLVGGICGIGCGFIAPLVAAPLMPGGIDPYTGVGYVALYMYIGYTIGNSLGVYWQGSKRYNGNYINTLVGAIIGGYAGAQALDKGESKDKLLNMVFILGPPLGSMLGFNTFRRAKVNSNAHSYIDRENGYFQYYSYNPTIKFDMLKFSF